MTTDEAIKDYYSKNIADISWSSVGVSICKPYIYDDATIVSIGYVYNKIAHIGEAGVEAYYILGNIIDLGPAIDIEVCYDGRWRGNINDSYDYYTIGEPYIATVDTFNRLFVRQGATGSIVQLANGVERCYMVRGWKHIFDYTKDQGLCVFYTRSGQLYSRAYTQIDADNYLWFDEVSYPELGSAITDIIVKRTADFRIVIVTKSISGNKIAVTDRMFPGMSIPEETISCSISIESSVVPHAIQELKGYFTDTLECAIDCIANNYSLDLRPTIALGAYNSLGTKIYLVLTTRPSLESLDTDYSNILIKDSIGQTFPIISIDLTNLQLVLTVMDFNNAEGTMTISYVSGMYIAPTILLPPFEIAFTPAGLIPEPPDPPIINQVINVDTEVV